MKNIKDITISIFAIIGFVAIITGFTNEGEQQTTFGTPVSHVYEFSPVFVKVGNPKIYKLNKVTGEVVLYEIKKATKLP